MFGLRMDEFGRMSYYGKLNKWIFDEALGLFWHVQYKLCGCYVNFRILGRVEVEVCDFELTTSICKFQNYSW